VDWLSAEGLGKAEGGRTILESCTLSLPAGRVVCLLGPSGLGKSTLLEILAGVREPGRGTVRRGGEVSLLFQDNALIPWLSAERNLRYVLPKGWAEALCAERVGLWLERFRLDPKMPPTEMSGGMRRRLALARAFIVERPITLLDEPFAFLDRFWHSLVAKLLSELAGRGHAAALALHGVNPELMEECGDRLVAVDMGPPPVVIPRPEGGAPGGARDHGPAGGGPSGPGLGDADLGDPDLGDPALGDGAPGSWDPGLEGLGGGDPGRGGPGGGDPGR
jgi:NitT/TauT family transport system ATP-binding protein